MRPYQRQLLILGMILCSLLATGRATTEAAVLYNIASFDANDASSSSSTTVNYDASLVSITMASGITGSSAADLLALQNINPNAATSSAYPRFRNTDADTAQLNGTLVTDIDGYFQFGIAAQAGQTLNLQSISLQAAQATAGNAGRGFNVQVSVDGGDWTSFTSQSLTNGRTLGLQDLSYSLAGAAYQDIQSIDFRFQSTTGAVEYTNIAINGSLVPEPSRMIFLALACMGMCFSRRKRVAP